MSVTTIQVCNRCGKPFEHSKCKISGYFVHGIRKENRMHFHSMYYGNPDGYSYCDDMWKRINPNMEYVIAAMRKKGEDAKNGTKKAENTEKTHQQLKE